MIIDHAIIEAGFDLVEVNDNGYIFSVEEKRGTILYIGIDNQGFYVDISNDKLGYSLLIFGDYGIKLGKLLCGGIVNGDLIFEYKDKWFTKKRIRVIVPQTINVSGLPPFIKNMNVQFPQMSYIYNVEGKPSNQHEINVFNKCKSFQ